MTTDQHACVYRAPDRVQASILESLLEEQGIPVTLSGGTGGTGLEGNNLMAVALWVPKEKLQEAGAILQAHFERTAAE